MRLIFYCLFFILILSPLFIFSQTFRQPVAAVYLGLNAYSTQHTDVFSFVNNQAALAQMKNTSVGVYGENRFSLAEISTYTTAAAFITAKGNFGISLTYSGFINYNENEIGLAYAKSLGKKIDVGIQFNHYTYQVPGYGSNTAIDVEMGAIVHLTENLNAGIHIYNPVGGNFSKGDEQLPAIFKTGFGYDVSDIVFISAEAVKEENEPISINTGVQYQFQKQFFVRAGIASGTSSFYAGAGVAWDNLRLDISCSVHPQLGISPGLLLIINFDKKK